MHWQAVIKKLKGKIFQWDSQQLKQLDKMADIAPGTSLIPENVTLQEKIEEVPEQQIVLNFDFYKESECRFAEIDETKAVAIFKKLAILTNTKVKNINSCSVVRKKLRRNDGQHRDYRSLFLCIPPDEENVYEIEIPENGRIFFFLSGNKACLICIETKHRDTHAD